MMPAPNRQRNRGRKWPLPSGLVALLPFQLFLLSRDVVLETEVAPNGAAYRVATVVVAHDRLPEAEEAFRRAFPPRPWQWRRGAAGGDVALTADYRHGGVSQHAGATFSAHKSPFSLWTTYTFTDRIEVEQIAPGEQAYAEEKELSYRLRLPGTIVETLPVGVGAGGEAEWRAVVGKAPVQLSATSREFRIWYCLILVYLALWLVGYAVGGVLGIRRRRPKRI